MSSESGVGRKVPVTLLALLLPGSLFGAGIVLLRDHPRFTWLHDWSTAPWEFWLVLISGTIATAAGVADWRLHRSGKVAIGAKEHHGEVLALVAGGLPLFVLMAVASVLPRSQVLLIPVLIVVLFTVVLICYDEFVFHRRRCDRYETLLHRLLVFGMGIAWLGWVHWCFVRGRRMNAYLHLARVLFDDPSCPLARSSRGAWRSLFSSGGAWMGQALEYLRGSPLPETGINLNQVGFLKYGLAAGITILFAVPIVLLQQWFLLVLCVPVFYAVEAQMVFLFPLILDGRNRPFHEARRWTVRAGGTLAVMRVVIPIACVMLLGGCARQGFVRSWCLGCLAICIWYEELRKDEGGQHGLHSWSADPAVRL